MFTPHTPSLRHPSLLRGRGAGRVAFTRINREVEMARVCLVFFPLAGFGFHICHKEMSDSFSLYFLGRTF